MRALLATALCLIGLSSYGQPLIRQFFTTNPAPIVDVVAGSNATVQASTPNAQTRRFTVNAVPAAGTGQTNNTIVVAGTNIVVTSVAAGGDTTYTVYGLTDTNVVRVLGTNVAAYQAQLATNALAAANSNLFVFKYGDTVSGPILTTSTSSNAPAQNELATGGWVRSLFNNGVIDYVTTNIDGVATNLGSPNQFVYQFWQGVIPQPSTRVWVSAFLTNNGYVGSVITTNTFSFLAGPVAINSYLGLSSGGGDALTVHPEIYYSYDKTNWYGDWEAQGQALTPGRTNLYQFIISFPAITATNSSGFYLQRRFKVNSFGGTPTLYVLVGTNNSSGTLDASHISFSGPNSAIGNAYLANNQTFTGSNQFSGGMMVWGDSYKTNGVWIGPAGEVLSNNLGSVTIAAGNITASGLIKGNKLDYYADMSITTNKLDCNTNVWNLVSGYNACVTNFANVPTAPYIWRGTLTVSNSTAAAIAFYITATGVRPIGSVTSNGIQIASGKILEVDFKVCDLFTNWAAAAQQ